MPTSESHHSNLSSPQAETPDCTVTVSLEVGSGTSSDVDELGPKERYHDYQPHQHQDSDPSDMAGDKGLLECPMCDFTVLSADDYILQLHFEQMHTTDSPFKIDDDQEPPLPATANAKRKYVTDTPSDDEEGTVSCPEPDCGELVLLTDFNDHLDYHAAESLSFDETTGRYHSQHPSATMHDLAYPGGDFADHDAKDSRRHDGHKHRHKKHGHRPRSNTASSEKSTLSRSILSFNPFTKLDKAVRPPNKSARLGRSELGPYAWEDRMPRWLHDQLAAGPQISVVNRIGRDGRLIKQEQVQNETPGIIPILAQLSALDRSVQEAYYCHPSTLHIGKTPKEGGFCGYRNIQMLVSYIQGAKAQGHDEFPGRTPGILKLQDLIERAWDKGINSIGRTQTGGIRDTRKYIGTPEAQAFFLSSEINCAVQQFSDNKEHKIEAHVTLLNAIECYFAQAAVKDGSNVYKTLLPPIYLQQPGHSITIIGFERRRDGICNLVVLDPMYSSSPAMHKLLGRKNIHSARPEVLHAYRRGPRQLRKHAAFEILMLTATPPLFPAWDVLRQFPDCRFVYAFFRARTLGYDVYPEDYFTSIFPWQQYGGLWVCDEARFARANSLNAITAQALRRITGEGASSNNSPVSPVHFEMRQSTGGMGYRHYLNGAPMGTMDPGTPAFIPQLDGSATATCYSGTTAVHTASPSLNNDLLPQPKPLKPHLSLYTDIGRKYPGFPTPLSPTLSAKDLFPSPLSNIGSSANTPRLMSPVLRSISASPMSIDGSEMCGPSRRCTSHGFEHYAGSGTIGLIDEILTSNKPQTQTQTRATTPLGDEAGRPLSPRDSQTREKLSFFPRYTLSPTSSLPSPTASIEISNGTESTLPSPLSPTSSSPILLYTSHRPASSGLLGVIPLSENEVAEYRFWTECGRPGCGYGCHGKDSGMQGEREARDRLFRGVHDVGEDAGWRAGAERDGWRIIGKVGADGNVTEGVRKSIWAGGNLVSDWGAFLGGCEREGVALY